MELSGSQYPVLTYGKPIGGMESREPGAIWIATSSLELNPEATRVSTDHVGRNILLVVASYDTAYISSVLTISDLK